MHNALLKVRAASVCQASRVVYGGVGAFLLWREADVASLGYWYTAVSWVSLLPFFDVGFTATAVDAFTAGTPDPQRGARVERVTALAAGYFTIIALALLGILGALGLAGRLPAEWRVYVPVTAMALATASMAVNMFQISLLQAAGNWERTQYLPVVPYLAATALMAAGVFGHIHPLLALALGQCILSFGLAVLLNRELRLKDLAWLRLGAVWRAGRQAYRGVLQTNVRYYYSIMAGAAIMRIAMFAGSLKMKEGELGDIGRMNQTLFTVISVCLFPINGMANRVVGDLRAGKDHRQVHKESLQLIGSALGLALGAGTAILFLINQRVAWLGSTHLSMGQQVMLLTSLLLDALAAGIVPMLAYLGSGTYWRGSLTLVALSVLPWVAYVSLPSSDFLWTKLVASVMVTLKIAADYRRVVA